jgi:hypothetical protein
VGEFGVAAAIAVAVDRHNLGVVREAIDERLLITLNQAGLGDPDLARPRPQNVGLMAASHVFAANVILLSPPTSPNFVR